MKIYYTKKDSFRDFIMGVEFLKKIGKIPNESNFKNTHVLVAEVRESDYEDVWMLFNSDDNPLIKKQDSYEELGIGHTSMSVGDVIEDQDGCFMMVDRFGFVKIF